MTRQEVMQKEIITTKDIEALFGVKKSKAYYIIASIKAVQDSLGSDIKGKCHIQDYQAFLKYNRAKKNTV